MRDKKKKQNKPAAEKVPHFFKTFLSRSHRKTEPRKSAAAADDGSRSAQESVKGLLEIPLGSVPSGFDGVSTPNERSTKDSLSTEQSFVGEDGSDGGDSDTDETSSGPAAPPGIPFGRHTRGLRIVHTPAETVDGKDLVDIIFIHGLTGDSYRTWRHRKSGVFWPVRFLSKDIPQARILTFGYDADVVKLFGAVGRGNLHSHALTLVTEIAALRVKDGPKEERRIIIVAHSLGGLVAKKAICISAQSSEHMDRHLDTSLAGLVFLGTPHRGSHLADYGDVVTGVLRLATLKKKSINRKVVEVLKPDSDVLSDLQWSFGQWFLQNNQRISVTCFHEEEPKPKTGIVVDPWSASLDGCASLGIPTHHSAMQKFEDHDSPTYRLVLARIIRSCTSPVEKKLEAQPVEAPRAEEPSLEWRKAYAKALSFPEMNSRFNSIQRPVSSTCEWLIDDFIYQDWSKQGHGILWILGHPGTGKSTLMKHAFKKCKGNAQSSKKSLETSAGFFFYNLGTPLQRSTEGLLRCLLHQLLEQSPEQMKELILSYQHRTESNAEGWDWEVEELLDHLESSLKAICQSSNVRIFVDALDECTTDVETEEANEDIRYIIKRFERLEESLRELPFKLSVCFACRHYPNLARPKMDFSIVAEKENNEDIQEYLRRELDREFDGEVGELKEGLQAKIGTRANGNFQWAKLVTAKAVSMHTLGANEAKIISAVETLPLSLSKMYESTIKSVLLLRRREMSLRLFRWVCFAKRPLDLHELRCALNAPNGQSTAAKDAGVKKENYIETTQQMKKLVSILSGGLAEVRSPQIPSSLHINNGKVFLIHQSVKDFLVLYGFRQLVEDDEDGHESYFGGHSLILSSCLRAMASISLGPRCTPSAVSETYIIENVVSFVFSEHCSSHMDELRGQVSINELLDHEIESGQRVEQTPALLSEKYHKITGEDRLHIETEFKNYVRELEPTDMHDADSHAFASQRFSLQRDAIRQIILCCLSFHHGNPVFAELFQYARDFWAEHAVELSESGNTRFVQEQIREFAAITDFSQWLFLHYCGSLIYGPSCLKDPVLLRTIISAYRQKGISINDQVYSGNPRYSSPLAIASESGYFASVKIILGLVDTVVNVFNGSIQSPLYLAAKNGHDEIVQELLNCGADPKVRDLEGKTAFSQAREARRTSTVTLLQRYNDGNAIVTQAAKDPFAGMKASKKKHTTKPKETTHVTAARSLLEECQAGDTTGVIDLVRAGADSEIWKSQTERYPKPFQDTPLGACIFNDHSETLEALLDPHCHSDKGLPMWKDNLLCEAAKCCAFECFKILIAKYGWEIDSQDRNGNTPLHLAIRAAPLAKDSSQYKPFVQGLLVLDASPEGIIINQPDGQLTSPLMAAIQGVDNTALVDVILADKRLRVNWRSQRGTALTTAVSTKNTAAVGRLLAHPEINPNLPTLQGLSPLSIAMVDNDIDLVQALLKHEGTLITSKDREMAKTLASTMPTPQEKIIATLISENTKIYGEPVIEQSPNESYLSDVVFGTQQSGSEGVDPSLFSAEEILTLVFRHKR